MFDSYNYVCSHFWMIITCYNVVLILYLPSTTKKYDSVMHKAPLKPSGFVNVIDMMIVT